MDIRPTLFRPLYLLQWKIYDICTEWDEDEPAFKTARIISGFILFFNYFTFFKLVEKLGYGDLYIFSDVELLNLPGQTMRDFTGPLSIPILGGICALVEHILYFRVDRLAMFASIDKKYHNSRLFTYSVMGYIILSMLAFFYIL